MLSLFRFSLSMVWFVLLFSCQAAEPGHREISASRTPHPLLEEETNETPENLPPKEGKKDLTAASSWDWEDFGDFVGQPLRALKKKRPDLWKVMRSKLGPEARKFISVPWNMAGEWHSEGSTFDRYYYCGATFSNSANPQDGFETSRIFIDPIARRISGYYFSEGALYEDIFLWELEDDAQAHVLASGEKRLRFIWEVAQERFLPLE